MSFLDRNTLVLCLTFRDPLTGLYEIDLMNELYAKQLGRVVAIAPTDFSCDGMDTRIEAVAPGIPDCVRTPFEIIFPQAIGLPPKSGMGTEPRQSKSERKHQ